MRIEPSGVVMIGECEIQLPSCLALTPAPVTAIWASPGRRQINVCRHCLEEMVRIGEWENPGAHISRRYDIAVYDNNDRLQLVVEVKKSPYDVATNLEDWATRIRRNLTVHSGIPRSVYFLLAIYPAPFYLWSPNDAFDAPPHCTIDVSAQMPRLEERAVGLEYQQETAVTDWLTALISAPADFTEPQAWLDDYGLREAIHGGRIVRQEISVPPRRDREPQAA